MPKQSGYVKRQTIALQAHDMAIRDHMRTLTLDIVTIALGQCGMNPEDLAHFRDVYMKTEQDYLDEIIADYNGNHDKSITYAKERIDRVLKEYVPEDMFVPYDKRYGRC